MLSWEPPSKLGGYGTQHTSLCGWQLTIPRDFFLLKTAYIQFQEISEG